MRELHHENLIPFIGCSISPGQIAILTVYCAHGSLEDFLEDPNFKLDNIFISSFVNDLLKVIRFRFIFFNNCFYH